MHPKQIFSMLLAACLLAGCASVRPEQTADAASVQERPAASESVAEDIISQESDGFVIPPPPKAAASTSKFSSASTRSVRVSLSTHTSYPGETVVIYVDGAKGTATAESETDFTPSFYKEKDGRQVALLPLSYEMTPGRYTLRVKADGKTFRYALRVQEKEFEVQHLYVDPNTTANTAGNAQADDQWERLIEPLKLEGDEKKHWSKQFIQPVEGNITTAFGMTRYTNGSTVASRHSGIDIAARTGTPVKASNGGRVQFADTLILTGNTVVIEHGYGLKSFYYHMDSLDVKEGQMVEKGQQVGAVGSTGFSTGPHLHFAMSVNNVFTNPWTLFEQGVAGPTAKTPGFQ